MSDTFQSPDYSPIVTALLTLAVATFGYAATYAFATALELLFRGVFPGPTGTLTYYLAFGVVMSIIGIVIAIYSGLLSALAGAVRRLSQ